MSDDEARGFLFRNDKLFGVRAKASADLKKEAEGSERGAFSTMSAVVPVKALQSSTLPPTVKQFDAY